MSVSKWAYDPERCDGEGCPGDCDLCEKPKTMEEDAKQEGDKDPEEAAKEEKRRQFDMPKMMRAFRDAGWYLSRT